MYDQAAEGVVPELRVLGDLSKIKVVTMDADPVIVSWVRQGIVSAVVSSPPFTEAEDALQMVVKVLEGRPITPKMLVLPMTVTNKTDLNNPAVSKEWWIAACKTS